MYIALQLLGVCDDSWLSETSLTATARGAGFWTGDFDSHVQHYSDWRHKPQACSTKETKSKQEKQTTQEQNSLS